MPTKNKTILKNYFINGAKPPQEQFWDLIDSVQPLLREGNGIKFTDLLDGTYRIELNTAVVTRNTQEAPTGNFTLNSSVDYEIEIAGDRTITIDNTLFQAGDSANVFVLGAITLNFASTNLAIRYEEDYNEVIPIAGKYIMYCIHRIGNNIIINRNYYN